MKHRRQLWPFLLAACWLLAPTAALPAPAPARPVLRQSFDLRVPVPPVPARIAGRTMLMYELHATNFSAGPLELDAVAVRDAGTGTLLASLRGEALRAAIGRPDRPTASADRLVIPPGLRAVVYLSVPVAAVPRALVHRLAFVRGDGTAGKVEGGRTQVRTDTPPVLGAPLRGGPWAAVYDPSWERGHRRVFYAVGGTAHLPGRFAIDWIRLDGHGRYARGDASVPAHWYGYGEDVLAVADATVAEALDDMREPATVVAGRKVAPERASGNYVALDLGDGRYAFYEHLQPGSIRVKAGDRVRRGQVIARLGYTGESTGPHLHFHVADADATLGAEGVPYGLRQFRLLGGYESMDAFGKTRWSPPGPGVAESRRNELPAPMAVVSFPEGTGP